MKNTVIKLRSRLDANVYSIDTSSISKILDYLVVLNNGRTYNVVETTAEIIEKISHACDTETTQHNTTNRAFAGIDTEEIFENIFGFKPDDDFDTVCKKLAGSNPRPRRRKKIVRTPFGPITTWVDEEE